MYNRVAAPVNQDPNTGQISETKLSVRQPPFEVSSLSQPPSPYILFIFRVAISTTLLKYAKVL